MKIDERERMLTSEKKSVRLMSTMAAVLFVFSMGCAGSGIVLEPHSVSLFIGTIIALTISGFLAWIAAGIDMEVL